MKKPTYKKVKSTIKSRNSEHDGLFTKRTVSFNDQNWREGEKLSDKVFGPHRNSDPERDVMEHIDRLEELARCLAAEKGYTSWLQVIEEGGKSWMAGTTAEDMSRDSYAFHLEMDCQSLRESLKKGDLFKCLLKLIRVEGRHRDIWIKSMERDFIKGRAQSGEDDQDRQAKALREWHIERPNCKNNDACDVIIGKKYNRSASTVRGWRRLAQK